MALHETAGDHKVNGVQPEAIEYLWQIFLKQTQVLIVRSSYWPKHTAIPKSPSLSWLKIMKKEEPIHIRFRPSLETLHISNDFHSSDLKTPAHLINSCLSMYMAGWKWACCMEATWHHNVSFSVQPPIKSPRLWVKIPLSKFICMQIQKAGRTPVSMGSVVSNTLWPIITFEADTVHLLSGAYLHTQKLQSTIIIHLECCLVASRQCTVGGKSLFSTAVNDSIRWYSL